MAEEKQNLLPHAQDVIFNNPSLKELIRLIKNGSVAAIWPSTETEFRDWNNGGWKKYAPRGQKLKSQKTAMTIYYGDNQDTASTGDINLEQTNEKFNNFIELIDAQKEEIVSLNFFDNVDDIYPDTIELSLNTGNGEINNAKTMINYGNTIIEDYGKKIEKIESFISRIENFNPKINKNDVKLSDNTLEEDYQKIFKEEDTDLTPLKIVKNTFNQISAPSFNIEDDITNTLINQENNIYNFSNISSLYNPLQTKINNILKMLELYYNDSELFYNNSKFLELALLQSNYENHQLTIINSLTSFFNDWENISQENLSAISTIKVPLIYAYNLTEDELKDIEKVYTKYVTPYKKFVTSLFKIKNPSITDQAETFWNNVLNNCKDKEQNVTNFNDKIEVINSELISKINLMASTTKLNSGIKFDIHFLADGTIQNKELIFNELDNCYTILLNERSIIEDTNYSKLLSESYQALPTINLSTFYNQRASVKNKINTVLTSLLSDQEKVIELYSDITQEYIDFINRIKELNIVSITPISFILSAQGIKNITEIENTIINQKNKMEDHLQAVLLISPEDKNIQNNLTSIINKTQNLINRLSNAKIIVTSIGSLTDFNNSLLKENKSDTSFDYTLNFIKQLIKVITNNDEYLMGLDESQIIPQPSSNYLAIDNLDLVLTNLYSILKINEQLNREYLLFKQTEDINSILKSWSPIYDSVPYTHYVCISVGSDIRFDNEIKNNNLNQALPSDQRDASITIIVDDEYHYPKINNLASNINQNTRNEQVLTVGGLASLFGGDGLLTERSVGSTYIPVHINKGQFLPSAGVVSGDFIVQEKGGYPYWRINHDTYYLENADGTVTQMPATQDVGIQARKLFGAVFNDYAEYRNAIAKPGQCVIEKGDGTLFTSTKRLQLGANIVSDTFGFAIGETDDATCPIAVSGRVLALPYEDTSKYAPGAAVCSGPNGTISLMTREEIKEWPDAIVGFVSEIPTYDTWGSDNVPVNGRIWIKIK